MKNIIILTLFALSCSIIQAQDLKVCSDDKGRCGYADEQGNVIVKCKYELAFKFENGIGKVGKGNKYGFVNNKGKEVLAVNYDEITLWSDSIYRIKSGGKYGLFSASRGLILKAQYTYISNLNCYGKAWIASGGKENKGVFSKIKVGIVDNNGNLRIEPIYDKIIEFCDDATINKYTIGTYLSDTLKTECTYVSCYKGDKVAIVDNNGNTVAPFVKDITYSAPTLGLCAYSIRESSTKTTTGYYDIENKKYIIISKKAKYNEVLECSPFYGDIARISSSNSCYLINKNIEKISEEYKNAVYNNGYWIVYQLQDTTKIPAVLDTKGNTIIDFGKYSEITTQSNGKLFIVKNFENKYGVIDINGNEVIPLEYTQFIEFINNWYFAVNTNNKTGVITESGEIIVPFEFHNIHYDMSNKSDKCTNIWVRKEPNGYWQNYDIAKKEIVGEEVISASNFSDNYAWVVPKLLSLNSITKDINTFIPYFKLYYDNNIKIEFINNTTITINNTENVFLVKLKEAEKDFNDFSKTEEELKKMSLKELQEYSEAILKKTENIKQLSNKVRENINNSYSNRETVDYKIENNNTQARPYNIGILIDKEGKQKTSIPVPLLFFPVMEKALNENNGKLTPQQERVLIFKELKKTSAIIPRIATTIEEQNWDF